MPRISEKLRHDFIARYGNPPVVVAAPGRVNLIGEHTDYNEGFVLPGAIDKKIYIAIAKNNSDVIRVFANQFNEDHSFSVTDRAPRSGWINYLIGVNFYVQEQSGQRTGGVDVLIDGDIPVGAGMSSSAALCSGFGFGLNEMFGLELSRLDLAVAGQQTEHTFIGVNVGIMDEFASLHGKKNFAIKLDCRSLEYEYIPFAFPEYRILLVNSMVHHSLASTAYNERRKQCEEGVAIMRKYNPGIKSLRDVTYEELARHWQEFPSVVYDRCSFVINENQRLLAACEALRLGDLKGFGEMMYASHKGLSKRYAVSCPELDYLTEITKTMPGVIGARMMGGGFGGCTINIVSNEVAEEFISTVREKYKNQFGIATEVYETQLEDGVMIEQP